MSKDHPLHAAIAELGLSIRAEFVPFSRSRNAREKNKTLNWKVTLMQSADCPACAETRASGLMCAKCGSTRRLTPRDILTTNYSAGAAHCPGYNAKAPATWDDSAVAHQRAAIAFEVEEGREAKWMFGAFSRKSKPILPDAANVIYVLVSDAGVLDCSTYEEWAGETGYDPDSRKGEAIYRACLEVALKLRNGIGEAALQRLRDASQDY